MNSAISDLDLPRGLWPVMLTPFSEDKSIDWDSLDRLTDWYLANGACGLFSCCLSSEVYFLTEEERIAVAGRVVMRAGRVPVVEAGVPGREPAAAARFMAQLMDTGVSAIVITACQLADEDATESEWLSSAEALLAAAPSVPLGLYEAPLPYHRLLSPNMVHWAVETGRFFFLKDTSCAMGVVRSRIKLVHDTPLRLLNAHAAFLAEAVRAGADGFSGIAANAWPGLCSWLVAHAKNSESQVKAVQKFIRGSERLLEHKYPASAKVLAQLARMPIQAICRSGDLAFTSEERRRLEAARATADQLLASLGM